MLDGLEGRWECESPIAAPEGSTSRVWVLPFKVASATVAGGTEEGGIAALAGGTQSTFPSPVPFVVAESVKALRRRAK
jgi:hypothetical protein